MQDAKRPPSYAARVGGAKSATVQGFPFADKERDERPSAIANQEEVGGGEDGTGGEERSALRAQVGTDGAAQSNDTECAADGNPVQTAAEADEVAGAGESPPTPDKALRADSGS